MGTAEFSSKNLTEPLKPLKKLYFATTSVYPNRVISNQPQQPFTQTLITKPNFTLDQKTQKSKMASKVRLNFHSDSEAMINKQINLELFASYTYMAMACYFDRDDVALHGFAKHSRHESEEERKHAMNLVELHKTADGHGDAQMTDFIEGEYLKEQVEGEK